MIVFTLEWLERERERVKRMITFIIVAETSAFCLPNSVRTKQFFFLCLNNCSMWIRNSERNVCVFQALFYSLKTNTAPQSSTQFTIRIICLHPVVKWYTFKKNERNASLFCCCSYLPTMLPVARSLRYLSHYLHTIFMFCSLFVLCIV